MNYHHHYSIIVERARTRVLPSETYTERHHVVPKCLGGGNEKSNIVKLTAEEHYLAHQLLVKMHPGNFKLIHAASAMSMKNSRVKRNNKIYGWIKRQISESNSGKNHRNYGKNISEETKSRIRETCRKNSSLIGLYGKEHPSFGKKRPDVSKRLLENNPMLSDSARRAASERMKESPPTKNKETRDKLSSTVKAQFANGRSSNFTLAARRVVCAETGKEFVSRREAAVWLNSEGHLKATGQSLTGALNNPSRVSFGLHWNYVQE